MWSKPDPNQRLQNANYLFLILECRISCEGHLFQKNYGFRPEIQIALANKTWQFLTICSFLRIFVIIYGWLIVCNYILTYQPKTNQPIKYLCTYLVFFYHFRIWYEFAILWGNENIPYCTKSDKFFANAKLGTVMYQWLYGWFNLQNISVKKLSIFKTYYFGLTLLVQY